MANETNNFVILSAARSGSTWVVDMLRSIDNTQAFGELFLPRPRPQPRGGESDQPRYVERQRPNLELRPRSVFSFLNRLYRKPGTVGFKLMYAQLCLFPEIWLYIWWRRIRVVHLVRRNHLDVHISREFLKIRKTPHFVAGQEPPRMKIRLNPATVVPEMKKLRRNILIARTLLRSFRVPHVEVAYEDLLGAPSGFEPIWDFLSINVERRTPTSKFRKIRKDNHADVISNYEDIKRALENTAFANLLYSTKGPESA